jgi:hypothetical protein
VSAIRLVLSCGYERIIDPIVLDAYGINEGDAGWCPEHEEATVDAMFVTEPGESYPSVPLA